MSGERPQAAPRCAAFVGPYLSGKTSLVESLLFASGAITRKGTVKDGNTVGDSTPEARDRSMSTEVAVATTTYLEEEWAFLDCPGSVELAYETQAALMVADVAVVVIEPSADKAMALAPTLKFLDDNSIPHFLYINKVDTLAGLDVRIRDLMQALQEVSARPLVLRQVPIREGETVTGYVDLVSERAYHYNPNRPSDLIPLPDVVKEREQGARQELLEALADYDDALMEQLLEDMAPDKEEVYHQLTKDLQSDLIVPVLLGTAEKDGGIRRLFKALRHEVPESTTAAARLGVLGEAGEAGAVVQVFKTTMQPHAGRLSYVRVWKGAIKDGINLGGERVSGVMRLLGQQQTKLSEAVTGSVVALGRLDSARTGDLLTDTGVHAASALWPSPPPPVYGLAIHAENRADEVKLTSALQKLTEEDPSLSVEQSPDTGELVLWGQGDIHLAIALDRLRTKYNVTVRSRPPQVPYKETIRKGTAQHSRFKRQSGGHGQFADIHIEIKPLPRGAGFEFTDSVVGGVVPRQFIPAVEVGVREFLHEGPMGFPVVDVAVNLSSGQYHSVDSSEMAFKTCGRQAMQEAMPKCEPVLLEPILLVTIAIPNDFTSKVQRLVSSRRGQILGFDAKPDWKGWDEVNAYIPQSEMHDLIVELRSLSQGTGSFTWQFDRLAELTGRLADKAVEHRRELAAAS